MNEIQLNGRTEGFEGVWTLRMSDAGCFLLDPSGNERASYSIDELEDGLVLPTLLEPHLFILIPEFGPVRFGRNREKMKIIRQYFLRALALQGPPGIAKLRWKGYRAAFWGILVIVVGAAITLLSFQRIAGSTTILLPYGLMVYGMFRFWRGMVWLFKAQTARKIYYEAQAAKKAE